MRDEEKYPMPEVSRDYLSKLVKAADQSQLVREIIHAAHHVLAGGHVSVEIVRPGDPEMFRNLCVAQAGVLQAPNEANKAAGIYVTAVS